MGFYSELHAEDDGETVVLFPVGDFYELYGADAEKAAVALDIQLTSKTLDNERRAMCGFPRHSLEAYVNVLNDKGFDVILTDDNRKSYKVLSAEKIPARCV